MLEGHQRISRYHFLLRWLPSLILLPICAFFIMNRGEYTYVDYFHKVVHEAGRAIFGLFGDVPLMAGGTVTQLMVPVLLIIFFYVNYMRIWLQFSFFLLGHTFLNIGVYAADAAAMKIDLFGPPEVKHDWNWLLTHYNGMQYSPDIEMFCFVMALIAFAIAIITPKLVAH